MDAIERRAAIYVVLNTWTDYEAAKALEWVENDMPILLGKETEEDFWAKTSDGKIRLEPAALCLRAPGKFLETNPELRHWDHPLPPWERATSQISSNWYFDAIADPECTVEEVKEIVRKIAHERGWTTREVTVEEIEAWEY